MNAVNVISSNAIHVRVWLLKLFHSGGTRDLTPIALWHLDSETQKILQLRGAPIKYLGMPFIISCPNPSSLPFYRPEQENMLSKSECSCLPHLYFFDLYFINFKKLVFSYHCFDLISPFFFFLNLNDEYPRKVLTIPGSHPVILLFYHTSPWQLLRSVPILLLYDPGVANRFMSVE